MISRWPWTSRVAARRRLGIPGLAFVGLGASCALVFPDDYELDSDSTTGAGGIGGSGGAPIMGPIGAPCTLSEECLSGYCVDSNDGEGRVCCSAECKPDDPTSCGRNGKCDPGGEGCASYPAGEECAVPSCVEGLVTNHECQAGACSPTVPVRCAGGLDCENATACLDECTTNEDCENQLAECPLAGSKFCTEEPAGAPCASDIVCKSGLCEPTLGECCATICSPTEGPCGATGCGDKGCLFPEEETACGASPSCANGILTSAYCDGSGECGASSIPQPCPGHLRCVSELACHESCGSNDATGDARCIAGYWCDGATCRLAKDEGESCTRGGQCHSTGCSLAGECTSDCDRDGDLQDSEGMCGGLDCDDNDPLVWEGQPEHFDTPRSDGSYDYDCSGVEEAKHRTTCSFCYGKKLHVADGAAGCGKSGPLEQCGLTFFGCIGTTVLDDNVTQSCH